MAVHLTRIYTKTGDDGTTALGRHVPGAQDRSAGRARTPTATRRTPPIGVAIALGALPERIVAVLRTVQNDLFDVGADLCTPVVPEPGLSRRCASSRATSNGSRAGATSSTPTCAKLDSFILPGGTPGAALLHQARTLARRAERSAWALYEADPEHTNREALLYLNRLSDLLFILARVANPEGDVKWKPGGER